MRGIVLKNHDDPTGGLAYIVRKEFQDWKFLVALL